MAEFDAMIKLFTVSAGRPNKHLESVHALLNGHSKIRNRISAKRRDNLNTSIETALKLIVYAEAGDKDGMARLIIILSYSVFSHLYV